MATIRSLIYIPTLFLGQLAMAQQEVRLSDPSMIVMDADLAQSKHAMAGMQAAGLSDELIAAALKHSDPRKWPQVWRSDSLRAESMIAISNAKAYRICDYAVEEARLSIVQIPVKENYHLPEGLRSPEDFYVVIQADGLSEPPAAQKPKASKGPSWRSMPKAKITKPDQVYATYNLGQDQDALLVLEKRGMSQPEIDAVIFRSHERNWPEGIDEFQKRHPKLKHFKKFKAHVAARWGDKVLVVIPAELNKNLPPGLRPYMDIYMVYTSPAVAEMKK